MKMNEMSKFPQQILKVAKNMTKEKEKTMTQFYESGLTQ